MKIKFIFVKIIVKNMKIIVFNVKKICVNDCTEEHLKNQEKYKGHQIKRFFKRNKKEYRIFTNNN